MNPRNHTNSDQGGPAGSRWWLLPIGGLLLAVVAYTCTFTVEESQAAIVLQLGRPVRVVEESGIHLKLPVPIQTVVPVDMRLLVLTPPPAEYLTSDTKNLLVEALMAYKVVDPLRYVEAVASRSGAELRLQEVLRSRVGAALGRHALSQLVNLDPAEVKLVDIQDQITRECDGLARQSFGISVRTVAIKRIMFPPQNMGAVYRRMAAERERIAKRYLAEGEEQAMKIRSQAKLESEQIVSKAKKEAQIIIGQADAEVADLYGRTFSKDPELFEFLKRLETYQAFIKENGTVVLGMDSPLLDLFAHGPGGGGTR